MMASRSGWSISVSRSSPNFAERTSLSLRNFSHWSSFQGCSGISSFSLMDGTPSFSCYAAGGRWSSQAVAKDFASGIVTASAHDPSTGVRGCAAQVQALDRGAIVGIARCGPQEEHARQRHGPLKDVASGQTESPLQVERRDDLAVQDGAFEIRSVLIQDVAAAVGKAFFDLIPIPLA